MRTGKLLAGKFTRVDVVFKKPLLDIFSNAANSHEQKLNQNVLTIYIDPKPGFSLTLNAKKVGQGYTTEPAMLEFFHSDEQKALSPEPYERLFTMP